MATLEKVQAQIAKLQAQAEALAVKQSSGVLAKIREIMEKHGLTTADIEAHIGGSKKRGRKPGVKVSAKPSASVAKYRDPKSGATWTGHGRAPAWIANAKDRSKFLTEGASEAPVTAAKKAGKVGNAGNYVRGPQAPKYRDPATGATWSGRGRGPAWLAGAKDRTAFLIAGADEGSASPTKAATKAPAKNAAAKKVSAKKAAKKMGAAKKVAPKKVAAKKVAAKKSIASAKKAPVKKVATKKVTAKKAAAKKAGVTSEAPTQASTPTSAGAAESTSA